jgi:hypothetical protein
MNLQNGQLSESVTQGGKEKMVGQRWSAMGRHDEGHASVKGYLNRVSYSMQRTNLS